MAHLGFLSEVRLGNGLGYIDDEAWARSRSEGLLRRGYGPRTGIAVRLEHDRGIFESYREAAQAFGDARGACERGEALSVGLVGNCAEVLPELVRRGVTPDVLTDQTSAHDALNGYVPAGLSPAEAEVLRQADPVEYTRRSMASMATHCRAMVDLMHAGAITFDYGNNLRGQAKDAGYAEARRIWNAMIERRPALVVRPRDSSDVVACVRFARDSGPIEAGCDCYACRNFGRGAIRHFFFAGEMLGPVLASVHNIRFYQRLMSDLRRAIGEGDPSPGCPDTTGTPAPGVRTSGRVGGMMRLNSPAGVCATRTEMSSALRIFSAYASALPELRLQTSRYCGKGRKDCPTVRFG